MSPAAAKRNDNRRVDEAAQSIEDAMVALTRAICLLGFDEGKQVVQQAHLVVADTYRVLHERNDVTPATARYTSPS